MTIKKAYGIGNNTSKSLSPTIFNYWFKKYNIDAEYSYIEIKEKNFDKEIQPIINNADFCGINITVPYKEKIIPLISEISSDSKKIRAVNSVSNKNNVLVGDNTDWIGFKNSIKWLQKNKTPSKIKKKTAIIIGYGGAAKATVHALSKMGFEKIKIFNRSFEKIKNIKNNHNYLVVEPYEIKDIKNHLESANIIINTVPTTILTKDFLGDKWRVCFDKKIYGYDLVYNTHSDFLELFSDNYRIKGQWMLIFQAVPCFKMWFGIEPTIDKGLIDQVFNNKYNFIK